ncbi:MAG: hypothetical protein LBB84_04915 [Tannerellaceae bacterium]|nr:hypothetical protein [Tannerellaceae bacterium]
MDIHSKIMEVGTDVVKYKRAELPNGPDYVLSASEIFMIKYRNGKDVFVKDPATGKIQIRHIVTANEEKSLTADIKFRNGTKEEIHTVSLGEIGRNDKGNITVELIRHHPADKVTLGQGKIPLPAGMRISAGNRTTNFAYYLIGNESFVYEFETTVMPMQITVYGNDGTGRSTVTFDAQTKLAN